jgi:hypothetical protein
MAIAEAVLDCLQRLLPVDYTLAFDPADRSGEVTITMGCEELSFHSALGPIEAALEALEEVIRRSYT